MTLEVVVTEAKQQFGASGGNITQVIVSTGKTELEM